MNKQLNILFLFLLLALNVFAQDDEHYDEVFEGTKHPKQSELPARVRKFYEPYYRIYGQFSPEQVNERVEQSKILFTGDNALHPLPRVIERAEYDESLKPGVAQRGRALLAFLKDYYSNKSKKQYQEQEVIPNKVLKRIIKRNHEQLWQGYIDPDTISFWYGPDIIRDSKGKFRVIEDNPGFIGGMGDLKIARQILMQLVPEYERLGIALSNPDQFYKDLISRYRNRMSNPNEVMVMLRYSNEYIADNEDIRIEKLMAEFGDIETVKININNVDDRRMKNHLIVKDDGVYLETRAKDGVFELRKVGMVIIDMDPFDADPGHPANLPKRLVEEAKEHIDHPEIDPKVKKKLSKMIIPDENGDINFEKLEKYLRKKSNIEHSLDQKQGVPGLFKAAKKGKVKVSVTPGYEFLGDKELYMYVEDMIRFYLNEEPIIRNIETKTFMKVGKKNIVDMELLDHVLKTPKEYVVKRVDGRGGDAVWVGPKMNAEEFSGLKGRILEDPSSFIFQRYTPLSVMQGNLVDMRVISEVGSMIAKKSNMPSNFFVNTLEGNLVDRRDISGAGRMIAKKSNMPGNFFANNEVLVTDTPWGRGVPMTGDGKVNISAAGFETTVLVVGEQLKTNDGSFNSTLNLTAEGSKVPSNIKACMLRGIKAAKSSESDGKKKKHKR